MTFNEAKETAKKWADLHGESCVVTRSLFGYDSETQAAWDRAPTPKPTHICTVHPAKREEVPCQTKCTV